MMLAGLYLISAAVIAGALIFDCATREPEKRRPLDLADRKTWRRPRLAWIQRAALQCFYFAFTLAAVFLALRWAEAI